MDPFTIFVAVVSIISGVASYQQAKKMQREADRESRGVEANIESNIKAIPVIYGERRVGGTRVYIDTSKDIGNKYLYMVMAMAEGEVEDIHSIEIDDVPITDEKFILSGLGANFTYEIFYGSDTQSASDLIIDGVAYSSAAEVPPEVAIYLAGQESDKPWNQNHKLNGVAYLAMRFLWDTNAYNGVPNVTAIVKGKKVYDPRNPTAPKAWSNNPALCIRDYLTSSRYGKGIPESAINDTMFSQAANDYDSFIVTPYDGGDDITLFELNTVIDTEVQIINNLNDMLMSCRGFLPYVDGKYGIRVDQATNHVMDVSSDHIIGGISIVGTKKEDRFNQVKVNFFNKDKEYKEDTAVFPDVDDPSDVNNLYQQYLAEDGGEPLVDDIKIDGISNYYTAREMAKLFLLRSRLGTAIAFRGTSELMELEVGDTFLITQPTPAWTNKKFQVQEIGLNFDGTVNIQAIEYSDSIYTYNEASEETPFVPTKLPDPNKLAPVTALSASAGTDISADGKTISFIDLSWTAPNDALVDRYEIKYTIDDVTSVVYSAVAIDPTHRIVDAEGSYDISVYAVNGFGAKSTGVTLSNVLSVTDTTAPSNITGINISAGLQSITLDWTNPSEKDFDLVRIKHNTVDELPSSHSFEVRSDSFVHDIGAYSTTKHYWLAPVDRTGNIGNYVSGGSATTGSIAIGDVPAVAGTFYLTIANDNVITDDKFLAAIGRNPIEGDVVVLNKEYFFTRGASAWEAVTEFIDGSLLVSGSLSASDITTGTLNANDVTISNLTISGEQLPNNVAYIKDTKNIAVLINEDLVSSNVGEAILVGYTDGSIDRATDGFITYKGQKYDIQRGGGQRFVIMTTVANKSGYIVYDSAGTQKFDTGFGVEDNYNIGFVWFDGTNWRYDNNSAADGVIFTPAVTDLALGIMSTSSTDLIASAELFFEVVKLTDAPEKGTTTNYGYLDFATTDEVSGIVSTYTNDQGYISSVNWDDVQSKPDDIVFDGDITDVVRTGEITDVVRTGEITDVVRDDDITDVVRQEQTQSNVLIDEDVRALTIQYPVTEAEALEYIINSPSAVNEALIVLDILDAEGVTVPNGVQWSLNGVYQSQLNGPDNARVEYKFVVPLVSGNNSIKIWSAGPDGGTVYSVKAYTFASNGGQWFRLSGRANTSAPSEADFKTAFGREPAPRDVILVESTTGATASYYFNKTIYAWDNAEAIVHGDLIVSESITALGEVTAGTFSLGNGAFTVNSSGQLNATSAIIDGNITANTLTLTGAQVEDSRSSPSLILSSSQLDQSVINLIDTRIEGYGLASSGYFAEDTGGFNNTIPDHPVLENFTHLNGKNVVIELTASSTWSGTGSPTYPPLYPNNDSSLVIEIQRRVSTETDWTNAVVVDTITNGTSPSTVITGGTWVYGYSSVWFNGLTINYTFNDDPATGTYDYRAFIKTIGNNYIGVSTFYFEANEAGTASGGGVNNYVDSFSINDSTGLITVGRTGSLGNLTASISTYVGNQVSALVDSAPATLDTLNELAAALGDDANFSATMTTALGNKANLSGDAFTGNISINGVTSNIAKLSLNEGGIANPDNVILEYDGTGSGDTNYFHIYSDVDTWMDKGESLNIQPSTGKVDIGGTTFTEKFNVNGNVNFTGTITASGYNKSDWDTAYGWGDHASAGYLTSVPAEYLTQTEGDARYHALSGSDLYKSATYPTNTFIKQSSETLYTGLTVASVGGVGIILDTNNNDVSDFVVAHGSTDIDTATKLFDINGSGQGATIYLDAETSRAPVGLTLHSAVADINGAGYTDGNFIDFKITDTNATFTPQARIGMLVKDHSGDGGIPSEGTGNFVISVGQGTDTSGNGTLKEALVIREDNLIATGTNYSFTAYGNISTSYGNITASNGYVKSGSGGFYVSDNQVIDSARNASFVDGTFSGTVVVGSDATREPIQVKSQTYAEVQFFTNGTEYTRIGTAEGGSLGAVEGDFYAYGVGRNKMHLIVPKDGSALKRENGTITIWDSGHFANNSSNWNTAYTYSQVGHLPLAGGTLTGNLTLNSATPEILFNGTSDAGVDMAIKATPEGLDFYEPEDVNKIHFQILDDAGVNAPFGYNVGTTQVIDSSGNVKKSPTLTLSGDVSGTATFTNLGNATLTATVANDSHTHDGRYYTESESDSRFLYKSRRTGCSNTGAGWYRIARSDAGSGRGSFQISFFGYGGTNSPQETVIRGTMGYGTTHPTFISIENANGSRASKVRGVQDDSKCFIEVYLSGALTDLGVECTTFGIGNFRVTDTATLDIATGTETSISPEYDIITNGKVLLGDTKVVGNVAASSFNVNGTEVIDSERNITNIGTITSSGSYTSSDKVKSVYSSTNYSQLESNPSGGVLRLEGGGTTLLRSYGISEFPNGLGIGTTTVIDSSRNATFANLFATRPIFNSESAGDDALVSRWRYGDNDAYQLNIHQRVTSGVVRWSFGQVNASTNYPDLIVLDRGKVGFGTQSPAQLVDVHGNIAIGGTTVIDSSRNISNVGTISLAGTSSRPMSIGQAGSITTKGSSGGWSQGLLYYGSAGTYKGGFGALGGADALSYFWIGSEFDDGSNFRFYPNGTFNIGGTTVIDSSRNLTNIGSVAATTDSNHKWYTATTNTGAGVVHEFSDQVPNTQKGYLKYFHADARSHGSGNAFTLTSTEPSLSFAVDGKVIGTSFHVGFNASNSGTQIVDSSRNAYFQSLRLTSGENIEWGGDYSLGYPTIAASGSQAAGVIAFYPAGSSGAQVLRLTDVGADVAGDFKINGTTVIDSGRNITVGAITASGKLYFNKDGQTNYHSVIDIDHVENNLWSFVFQSSTVGNDNESGFWVGSNGYPDLRIRRDNATIRALISSWETSYVSNNFNVAGGDLQIGGTTVIDSARNATVNKVTATASGMSEFSTDLSSNDDYINSPISIRERNMAGSAASADMYAPNLNFHWSGRVSNSLWMNSAGHLVYGGYGDTGTPAANGVFAAGAVRTNTLTDLADTSTFLELEGDSLGMRLQTSNGFFRFGARNSTWCHMETDRSGFYFYKKINVVGTTNSTTGYEVNGTTVINSSRNIESVSTLSVSDSAANGTSNGMTYYQWEGATYRNPGTWTARQVIRIHNDTAGDNGHYPSLVLYNESGLINSTVGLSFASREADAAGNTVPLAGIHATKTITGVNGAWSSGSLTAYVKDLGVRRNVWTAQTDGSMYIHSSLLATGNITASNGWVKSGSGGFYVSGNQIVNSSRDLLNIGNITCSGTNNTLGDINIQENVSATGYTFMRFKAYSTGNTLGSIYRSYGSMVYSTSSDYRLKENIVDLTGASDKIRSIPVRRFNFIEHPDRIVDGFLAHEVAKVVPEAVLGEKDAVDANGKPEYQSIDQSKLVPLLTAGLQEALTEIENLKARLSALEN